MQLNGKLVLILGLGESGLAMARWCARRGACVRVADTRADPPSLSALRDKVLQAQQESVFIAGEFNHSLLEGVDLLALSPGLSPLQLVVCEARARGIPVVGEIELFAQGLIDLGVRDRTRIIAITGTNGKTTTTALTGHLCRVAGMDTEVAGNISPAALDVLMARLDAAPVRLPDIWVLELSSFQLETLASLYADAATVLNVSDDHLDRYSGLDEYASAKARVFLDGGRKANAQVLNRQDARVKSMAISGRRLISFGLDAPGMSEDFGLRFNGQNDDGRVEPWLVQGDRFLLPVSQMQLAGLHNVSNALAALALCHAIGLPPVSLLTGLRSFKGLPHRVEKIAEIGGVVYYDDSKGTNVGATVAALQGGLAGDGGKVVLIAGGDGKGQDFSPLREVVARHARAVLLIGRDAQQIDVALAGSGVPRIYVQNMDEAVRVAASRTQPGDGVLLSPACASWDMYRNYVHRAEVFAAAVQALAREAEQAQT